MRRMGVIGVCLLALAVFAIAGCGSDNQNSASSNTEPRRGFQATTSTGAESSSQILAQFQEAIDQPLKPKPGASPDAQQRLDQLRELAKHGNLTPEQMLEMQQLISELQQEWEMTSTAQQALNQEQMVLAQALHK